MSQDSHPVFQHINPNPSNFFNYISNNNNTNYNNSPDYDNISPLLSDTFHLNDEIFFLSNNQPPTSNIISQQQHSEDLLHHSSSSSNSLNNYFTTSTNNSSISSASSSSTTSTSNYTPSKQLPQQQLNPYPSKISTTPKTNQPSSFQFQFQFQTPISSQSQAQSPPLDQQLHQQLSSHIPTHARQNSTSIPIDQLTSLTLKTPITSTNQSQIQPQDISSLDQPNFDDLSPTHIVSNANFNNANLNSANFNHANFNHASTSASASASASASTHEPIHQEGTINPRQLINPKLTSSLSSPSLSTMIKNQLQNYSHPSQLVQLESQSLTTNPSKHGRSTSHSDFKISSSDLKTFINDNIVNKSRSYSYTPGMTISNQTSNLSSPITLQNHQFDHHQFDHHQFDQIAENEVEQLLKAPKKRRKSSIASNTQQIIDSTTSPSISPTTSRECSKAQNNNALLPNAQGSFQCTDCDKQFKRSEHLKRHVRSVHSNIRPFHCKYCEKKFSRSDNLAQHLKTHYKVDSSGKKTIIYGNPSNHGRSKKRNSITST